jgi:hypothetical protein
MYYEHTKETVNTLLKFCEQFPGKNLIWDLTGFWRNTEMRNDRDFVTLRSLWNLNGLIFFEEFMKIISLRSRIDILSTIKYWDICWDTVRQWTISASISRQNPVRSQMRFCPGFWQTTKNTVQFCFNLKWLNADVFCIVYDITNKESLKNANFWHEKVKEFSENNKKIPGLTF